MFMLKLFNKLLSSLSSSCIHHKLLYKLSPSSYVYGKTAKLLNILSQWMSQCVYKAALHFANTKSHNKSSVMRALWKRMKMPPWLKILSTVAEVAGTQYIELTKWRRDLNCSLQGMFLTVAFGDEDANSRYDCTVQCIQCTGAVRSWTWNFSRPILQDRDQDQDHKYQDQDRIKLVSSAVEIKTTVSMTTSLHYTLYI